jgi:Flp pilus assembly protein TadD
MIHEREEGHEMLKTYTAVVVAALIFCAVPAFGAAGMCEAHGEVLDRDGNPLKDAVVTFTPKIPDAMSYSDTTSKKGKYFVPGMFNPQGDEWEVTVELEGYTAVEIVIETRTVNRVLVGDIYTKKLNPNSGPQEVIIKQMGKAKVDFTMAPTDEVMQEMTVVVQPGAVVDPSDPDAPVAPVQPKVDPWALALKNASDGDLDAAIPFFDEAIEEEPEDAERRGAYAKVLYQMERYDEAEAQVSAAIELAPEDVDARMVLYSIKVAQGDFDRARSVLEETQAVAPGDIRILRQLAFVASESGDSAQAISAYEELTAAAPDDSAAWMALGDLYAGSGQLDKSEQAYQRVVELEPSDAHQIFFNIGALIINKPNRSDAETRKAIGAFRKAVEIKPDYAQAYKQLAFALIGVGDRTEARGALEQYVKLAPSAPDAAQMKAIIQTLSK